MKWLALLFALFLVNDAFAEAQPIGRLEDIDALTALTADIDGTGDHVVWCRENNEALAKLALKLPGNLDAGALSFSCAQALGDVDQAEKIAASNEAIVSHMLRNGRGQDPGRPAEFDSLFTVYALGNMLGLDPYSISVLPAMQAPTYLVAVAMSDPVTGKERMVYGQFISRQNAAQSLRIPGTALVFMANTRQSFGASLDAMDGLASLFFVISKHTDSKSKPALEDLRAKGGEPNYLVPVALACLTALLPDCADASVDRLIGLAEQKVGVGQTLLAASFAFGLGVKKSEKRALAALKAASTTQGEKTAAISLAYWVTLMRWLDPNLGKLPPILLATLRERSDYAVEVLPTDVLVIKKEDLPASGSIADVLKQVPSKPASDEIPWRPTQLDDLIEAERQGLASGSDVRAALEHAADLGSPAAMRLLGFASRDGFWGAQADLKKAQEWFELASIYGDVRAAVELANMIRHVSPDGGLRAAYLLDGAMRLRVGDEWLRSWADLIVRGGPGFEPQPQKIVDTFARFQTSAMSVSTLGSQIILADVMAMARCTADDPKIRDPAAAAPMLEFLQENLKQAAKEEALALHTLAACAAARGDFKAALKWQKRAETLAAQVSREEYAALLQRYRAKLPYIANAHKQKP